MVRIATCVILAVAGDLFAQPSTRPAASEPAVPLATLAWLPVKEVTVFKDGHAFVVHEGTMPVDASGDVVMDYLPTPVLGTFWPYSADENVRLTSVVSGKRRMLVPRTPLALRELLEANPGAEGTVTETGGAKYQGTILSFPQRSGQELDATGLPGSEPKLPEKGSVLLIRTFEGVKAVPIDRIQDFTFKEQPRSQFVTEEFRNLLTLKLNRGAEMRAESAKVGLAYLQRGLRWIPGYKIVLDGQGKAVVTLQATLVNELADLENVTLRLVIGVPSFAFKDTPDPISFQQVIAQVAQQVGPRAALNLSNAIMSQVPMFDARASSAGPPGAQIDLGPEVAGAEKSEDLFVFTVQNVTLRKGQRMVLPVSEHTVSYEDVFSLDVAAVPPAELRTNFNSEQQAETAKLLLAPKVMHKIRLKNSSGQPFTTAPALLFRGERVQAQGMMTYAAPGSAADVEMTAAVDVRVRKTEQEVQRTPNAVQWQGQQFARVDLEGKLTLTSYRQQPVEVEVTRNLLGNITGAAQDGVIEQVNELEEAAPYDRPWWNWYNWPWWWSRFNGVGRVRWTITLDPGKPVELTYKWNYFRQ